MAGEILVEKLDGGVAVVTLNRPQAMNALSNSLRAELCDAMAAIAADDSIRAVVLTGAGERAFTAGLDLKELGEQGLAAANDQSPRSNPCRAVESCGKPVVGAINGVAITGGFELALACTMLLASENARFADTHALVGIMPGWGLSQKLSRIMGLGRAKQMSLSGRFIDAKTAYEWGLVNNVLPAGELLGEAIELARSIASVDPFFLRAYETLIEEGYDLSFSAAMALENEVSSKANANVSAEEVEHRRMAVIERGRKQV